MSNPTPPGAQISLWLEGRSSTYPLAGTPHPYHTTACVMEITGMQELVAFSHPAAGATASLTLTNPLTGNQVLVGITGLSAALGQATASAGQLNNLFISGSLGGQYTAEGLAIGAVANAIDRVVWGGKVFISGNGNQPNNGENLTVAFAAAGITNLFQLITCWYHYGA